MVEVGGLRFTELIELEPSFDTECERRLRLNILRGYLGRVALLTYVPEDCMNFHLSLPSDQHITGQLPLPCKLVATTLGGVDSSEQKEQSQGSQDESQKQSQQESDTTTHQTKHRHPSLLLGQGALQSQRLA